MQVRHIRTRVVASAIAVMSAAAVMRSATDARSPSLPAEIAIDHSILERAGPRLPLLPSHRTVLGAAQAGAMGLAAGVSLGSLGDHS